MSESGSPARSHHSRRQLRERKQRKLYLEEWTLGDDEGVRGFSVAEKLESPKFAQAGMVREMRGADLTVGFLQQYGFNIPLLFRDKAGLGIRMPSPQEFEVNDVRLCVGSRRMLDVMDVNTQKNHQMTMKEWEHYYESTDKRRLLNVISLEFSHTRLDSFIQSPDIVRLIDWVDVVWPKQLKDAQTEGTNVLGDMMYPKVQKYCLMSVKNCYTDFHIDFGGTSVWYHILKGSKVFWLIPPTEKNLQLYEKWVLSGKQSDVFFGDTVEKCARVYLTAGNTFFIPTGWIHAVYTPTDSLVFGGNFLHSFGIVKQLKTAQVEDSTKVPQKFRYPFFTEMLWYVLARYVFALLGRSHLEGEPSISEVEIEHKPHVHLTHYELFGLKEIVMYLYDLPPQKKNVPELVRDPVALIKDVRTLVERHCKDKPDMAITGEPVLKPQPNMQPEFQIYDRMKVKEQIKLEIARKNQELFQEHTQLTESSCSVATAEEEKPLEESIKEEPFSNGHFDILAVSSCGSSSASGSTPSIEDMNFVSPSITKTKPPKKMISAAVAAAAAAAASATSVSCTNILPSDLPYTTTNATVTSAGLVVNQNTVIVSASSSSQSSSVDSKTNQNQPRRRRTRCKICAACQRSDCGECSFCLDMVKFGGPGRAKQTCMMRQCLSPMLPVTAQCIYCHLDGWRQTPVSPQAKLQAALEGPSALMECSVCYEIAHPDCAALANGMTEDVKGIINEDLPNSWECPTCCKSGKNTDYKPRHFRARQKSSEVRRVSCSSDVNSITDGRHFHENNSGGSNSATNTNNNAQHHDFVFSSESEMETISCKKELKRSSMATKEVSSIKTEKNDNNIHNLESNNCRNLNPSSTKRRKSDETSSSCSALQDQNHHLNSEMLETNSSGLAASSTATTTTTTITCSATAQQRKKNSIRSQLAQQMLNSSTRVLKKPLYAIRPTPFQQPTTQSPSNLALDATLLKIVFRYLPPESLVTCSSVCKIWSNVSVDPDLWKVMSCAEHKLSASLLMAIVRRQPEHLILDWTQIAKRQLAWIIARMPALKNLSLQNCPIQAVLALHTCLCPPLQILDLSFVRGLNDSAIRDILSPPKDSRPGLTDSKSRLRILKTLKIAGTDISDVALRYITQGLPSLIHLDLSSCQRVTDAGVAQIGTCPSAISTLVELNLSGCRLITELSLDHLSKCEMLTWLDLRHVPQVSTQAVIKFAARSKHDLCVKDVKLVEKRKLPLRY
ncbi:jmjC domain-containing histone demethylation protein 1 isoform X1 [Episyrphus balteatus]|uniref:jmjC domain-containing histone demethylation protein 1 isoform X1 n=2 Tax=Episyrphus balteatus TaxID=286459 RepID=UPI0024850D22|nr:jmjC domain-containing histone demethylation protein 1 isoform X1 [Episyrphus balteatus]